MKALPAPTTLARRTASVQRTDVGVTAYLTSPAGQRTSVIPDQRWISTYLDWQPRARRAGHSVGVVRFAGGVTADTVARVIPLIEQQMPNNEWEPADDPRLSGLLDEYRNARQTSSELVRMHAWHYSIAGEMYQTFADGHDGVEWGIWSKAAVSFDKPDPGLVTVRMAPDAKPTDEGATLVVPRQQVTRFWNPDEEWQAYATSPIVASIDDIKRWETLARYAQMTADSSLAMNGLLWWADDGWDLYASDEVDAAADDVGTATTRQEEQYYEVARQRFTGASDIAAVAPNLIHGPKDNGEPKWVKTGEALDPNGIAHREEALHDFARGTNLPGSLVLGGGPGDANHWTEWLVSAAFFDQAIAPTANRVFHSDLTATFLRRRLLVAGYDPTRYRIGYDAAPVIVSPDMGDRALKAWSMGLISAEAARDALGFTDADAPDEEDLRRLLEVLSKSATGVPTRVTLQSEPPGSANPEEPMLPAGPGNVRPGPPPGGPPTNGAQAPTANGAQAAMPPFVGASPDATPWLGAADPTRARVERTLAKLATLRRDLGRSLLDGATQAYEEALRQAGVRVASRARSRGTGKATEQRAREAVADGGPYGSLLGALGLRESDLLAGAFTTFEAQAAAKLRQYRERQAQLIAALDIDPDDFLSLDDDEATIGAGFLVASLLALARTRLLQGVAVEELIDGGQTALPGEVTGPVPARFVTDAIRLSESRAFEHKGTTPDHAPTVSPRVGTRPSVKATTPAGDEVTVELPNANTVEDGLAAYYAETSGGGVVYEWVHGFYGDPLRAFEPHEALNGFATPDIETDPELANSEGWPDVDYFTPGDHDGCTCEWVPSLTEPGEAETVGV